MYATVSQSLKDWNKTNDRHTKLQHVYGVSSVALLFIAGLTGLINYNLGQLLLSASVALAAVFFVNAIAWALADSFIFSKLTKRTTKR